MLQSVLSSQSERDGYMSAIDGIESVFPMGSVINVKEIIRDIVSFINEKGELITLKGPKLFLTTQDPEIRVINGESKTVYDHIILVSTLEKSYFIRVEDEAATMALQEKLGNNISQLASSLTAEQIAALSASKANSVKYKKEPLARNIFAELFYNIHKDYEGTLFPAIQGYVKGHTCQASADRLMAYIAGRELIAFKQAINQEGKVVYLTAMPEHPEDYRGWDVVNYNDSVSENRWLSGWAIKEDFDKAVSEG